MTPKEIKKLKSIWEDLRDLEKLFDERIVENNTVGAQLMSKQATHAFVLYRNDLFHTRMKLRKILNKNGADLIG